MMIYTVRPLPEALTVNYVDQVANTVVKTADLTGMMAETGDYQVSVPAGYLLAPGQAEQVAYQFAADDTDNVTIKVLPAVSTLVADDQGDSQLTVRYVDGSGKTLAPETTQTGQVGQPLTVTAPTIAGYQLAPGQSAETTGAYQGDAMTLTLTYEAVPETPAVVPTDGNVVAPASTPTTATTPTATATNQTEVANQPTTNAEPSVPQPVENATANSETDAQPASEPATTTTEAAQATGTAITTRTQPATQNQLVPTTDGHVQVTTPMTLPQTDERSSFAAVLGILLLGATWLAATVLRKRD
jgi:LPXTG-motif cell wall-anchored protein